MADPKDSKALVSAIMSKRGAESEGPEEMDESSESPGLETAAEDIMSAISSGDAKALTEALKSFVEMSGE